ncbi:HD domain-containing protein [Bacillus suaedaesalsae]|uniref:HD domain-containing protein n=1 Tax=Bacillus suaedaesalsae TaxID=2810349 RepID=A0ABS2DGX9_9BACI|nr:HD domain-containing protein [Bacillus suaedaesalsae]MBM6617736.1 HD domain-containing protein [Bacillus suaedaesalsae]
MRQVTLKEIYEHPIAEKFVRRSGMAHAISVSYHAFKLAKEYNVNPDWAVKAGFLHDIGHYDWYKRNGQWDYGKYKEFDIHPIKGAERAHKLLVRLGENKLAAKAIARAILFHTDSILPDGAYELDPLQKVVHLADEQGKLPGHSHHYVTWDRKKELRLIEELDQKIDSYIGRVKMN